MSRPAGAAGPARELLAIRLGSLGDVMLVLPALALLRARSPGARIAVVTKEAFAPLVAASPAVDEVIPLAAARSGPRGLLRLGLVLRARRFAAVYDLHGNPRSRFLAALAGGPVRRVDGRALARRRLVAAAWARRLLRLPPPRVSAVVAPPLAAIAAARAVARNVTPDELAQPFLLQLPPAASAAGEERLAGLARPRIALCPGARHPTKRWPGFAALGAALAARGAGVVVVLGREDVWDGPAAAFPVVRAPLLELAAVLAACDAAAGNDSGLTHVAVAVGTPAAVVFGPTTPALGFRPAGHHRAVERADLACRPCAVHGGPRCPRGDHACLEGIAPAAVAAALDDLLAAPRRPELAHVR